MELAKVGRYIILISGLASMWGFLYVFHGIVSEYVYEFVTSILFQISMFYATMKNRLKKRKVEDYDPFGWDTTYYVDINLLHTGGSNDE